MKKRSEYPFSDSESDNHEFARGSDIMTTVRQQCSQIMKVPPEINPEELRHLSEAMILNSAYDCLKPLPPLFRDYNRRFVPSPLPSSVIKAIMNSDPASWPDQTIVDHLPSPTTRANENLAPFYGKPPLYNISHTLNRLNEALEMLDPADRDSIHKLTMWQTRLVAEEVQRAYYFNGPLFDIIGVGQPLYDYVLSIRKEEFKLGCRSLLAPYGIVDCTTLFAKANLLLSSTGAEFSSVGGARNFFRLMCRGKGGKLEKIERDHLLRVAYELGWSESRPVEVLDQYRSSLAAHGIADSTILLTKGLAWYQSSKLEFPPYGGSRKFFSLILGRRVDKINLEILGGVADILFPEKV